MKIWRTLRLKLLSSLTRRLSKNETEEVLKDAELEPMDKHLMLYSILYEIDKARRLRTNKSGFLMVQLIEAAWEHIEDLVKRELEELGIKGLLNSLKNKE